MRSGVLFAEARARSARGVMRGASLLIALLTTGCMATIEGGPGRLYSVADEVAQARYLLEDVPLVKGADAAIAGKGFMNAYYAAKTESDRKFYRDEIIGRRMYIIDVQYSDYEASLTRERQLFGFGTSTANQALTIGSTLAASQSSARILSGLAGGVGALKGIYDSELIIAKTIQIVEGQMRYQRGLVGNRIAESMKRPTDAYPLSAALTDLEDYYLAGTFNSGLLKALGEAGENARIGGELRGNAIILRAGVFAPNETTRQALKKFLTGPQAASRAAAVNKCLADEGPRVNGLPLNFRHILDDALDAPTREIVISCLRRNGQPI